MKKNIYLVQPTTANVSTVYVPYAIGCLASYAWSFEDICAVYELKESFFLREDIAQVVARLEQPYLIGFSNYLWNYEYNKALAQSIKKAFPECWIVFGGPQIPANDTVLKKYDYIDILIHYEGEVSFRDLLRTLANSGDLSSINNISFRNGRYTVTTDFKLAEEFDFPSPYQSGYIDVLVAKNPQIRFEPLVETNRGCPFKCAYCSWGMVHSKVRQFPLERVIFDLEWCSAYKAEFVAFADANFGMFERDEVFVDKLIELKITTGYPEKFQVSYVSYSKGSWERVFRITKKLKEHGMDKGVTLSFQSMSPVVQTNIGRSNMNAENYKEQLKVYSDASIPTYTDLILGLPGESLKSYVDGLEELLELGQHTALFVHQCEWLPLSQMGEKEYMERFDIHYSIIPLNQPHIAKRLDNIVEFSRLITSTNTMSAQDWLQMNIFSSCVLCFHHLRLLQFVALYLYYEKHVKYVDFYGQLLDFFLKDDAKLTIFKELKQLFENAIKDCSPITVFDERFGNVAWPAEEYAFLRLIGEKERFFIIIREFLKKYFDDMVLLDELLLYQSFCLKDIKKTTFVQSFRYHWKEYFDALLKNRYQVLQKGTVTYRITESEDYRDAADYARKVVWYGRRGGRNIYSEEIKWLKE